MKSYVTLYLYTSFSYLLTPSHLLNSPPPLFLIFSSLSNSSCLVSIPYCPRSLIPHPYSSPSSHSNIVNIDPAYTLSIFTLAIDSIILDSNTQLSAFPVPGLKFFPENKVLIGHNYYVTNYALFLSRKS